ncbi:MAG: hypothetical protein KC766_19110 [Myxococcales bacterium]|nr:hypothetical protein [Myxococcales bacterium]
MQRDRLKASLKHLGINPDDYRVIKLLPLVYVAWADGKMEDVQAERIHALASRHFELSADGVHVLDGWLKQRPSKAYFKEGLHDLHLLSMAEDDMEVDFSELPQLLAYAEAIARTTASALDQPEAVDPSEREALEEIARELMIDSGESWAQLLEELGNDK